MTFSTPFGICATCGKGCYGSKAAAKKAARSLQGRKGRLAVYQCGSAWHFGHLPRAVVAGRVPRSEIYVKRKAAR